MTDTRKEFRQLIGDKMYNSFEKAVSEAQANNFELKNIATQDLVAVRWYTLVSHTVNQPLYKNDAASIAKVSSFIKTLDSALSQLPPFRGTVYRGTDIPADVIHRYKPGAIVTKRAFTSASTDPSIMKD